MLLPTATTEDERARRADTALLPIGSFEQHGPILPLATDAMIAMIVAKELARHYPVLLLPPITISCSLEHEAWPGTVSISATTLTAVVSDVYQSLIRSSHVHNMVIVNCHGGNNVLNNTVLELNRAGGHVGLFPSKEDWNEAREHAELETNTHEDMHAGELETSVLLHAHPELVRDSYPTADWTADDRRHLATVGMEAYTPSGVIGRPSLATATKGAGVLESLVDSFPGVLRAIA